MKEVKRTATERCLDANSADGKYERWQYTFNENVADVTRLIVKIFGESSEFF